MKEFFPTIATNLIADDSFIDLHGNNGLNNGQEGEDDISIATGLKYFHDFLDDRLELKLSVIKSD